jgi:hypothetical protein
MHPSAKKWGFGQWEQNEFLGALVMVKGSFFL